jgi:hypothetical protein
LLPDGLPGKNKFRKWNFLVAQKLNSRDAAGSKIAAVF